MPGIIASLCKKLGFSVYPNRHLPTGYDIGQDILYMPRSAKVRIMLDVGSHLGRTARSFHAYFPEAKIHCFEPVKKTYLQLETIVHDIPQITIHNSALGSHEGTVTIVLQDASEANSLTFAVDASSNTSRTETVSVRTLDSFLRESCIEKVDILKITTKGFEGEVLKGGEKSLAAGSIQFIICEVTFNESDHHHSHFNQIHSYLASFEYDFYGIYDIRHNPAQPTAMNTCRALFIRRGSLGSTRK
jgi:FkbM family methyltransferase